MSLQRGETLAHYQLVEKVGEGGMGVVWKARDTSLGREVALKLLAEGVADAPERLARLEAEARAVAALNHPGIVTLYSIEEARGIRFIAMEYVAGRTLTELIPSTGFPLDELLRISLAVAEAVSAAHRRGITHRDLKPGNVMVDPDGRVKVLDFGLAQSPAPLATLEASELPTKTLASPALSGTLGYMSPEQLQGQPAEARSDVFSLGVLVYEMATGRRPFSGRSVAELISSVLRDTPVPPSRIRPELPVRLDRLLARCLDKDPRYRLASAAELAWELEQVRSEAARAAGRVRSIAVLPFADRSREKDQDYLCAGLAEEIIIALSKLGGLRVASRAASFRFAAPEAEVREIGRRLGVEAILHGSVRRAGERMRITAELIDASDGFEIWAEGYDRDTRDILAIQHEIAHSIVHALELTLSEKEREALSRPATTDVEAYEYYLRAREFFYHYTRKGMRFALEMLSRAIEKDPAYARAYAGISDCCAYLYYNAGRNRDHLEWADSASQKALALDPELAEAHASRGVVLSMSGRHAEAEQAFETAIRLAPELFEAHYFYARDAFTQGRLEKAVEEYERAMRARPEDYQAPLLVAQVYDDLGSKDAAEAARRRGVQIADEHLRLHPDDVRALYMGANGLVALGERERGLEWANRALALDPDDAMLLYNIACIKSLAGVAEEALDCVERAVSAGLKNRGWLEHDSNLDAIRAQPRFQALLARLA